MAVKARSESFKTVTRTKTLPFPTNLGPRIYAAARELLERVPAGPLRLVGVQVSNLDDVRTPLQGQLFGGEVAPEVGSAGSPADSISHERLARATEGVDRLRRRFGRDVVMPASLLPAKGGQQARQR